MPKKYFSNSAPSYKLALKRLKLFRRILGRAFKNPKISEEIILTLKALAGEGGFSERLLLSDMVARKRALKIVPRALLALKKSEKNTTTKFFLATFIDDIGNTSDRVPVVNIKLIKDKVYRALKQLGLNGLVVIEVHPLMNHPGGGEGRTLMYHAHAIVWTADPFSPEDAAAKLLERGAWNNSLGAEPVNFKLIDDEEGLKRAVRYLLKPPHCAKNRMPKKNKPGRYKLMDTVGGYRPELALRVFEGLSQIEMMDAVFGVGDGTKVRQEFRAAMVKWHRSRKREGTVLAADFDIWRFWFNVRQHFGSKRYLPYRFSGGGIVPRPAKVTVIRRSSVNRAKARRSKVKRMLSSRDRKTPLLFSRSPRRLRQRRPRSANE